MYLVFRYVCYCPYESKIWNIPINSNHDREECLEILVEDKVDTKKALRHRFEGAKQPTHYHYFGTLYTTGKKYVINREKKRG
ncbi:MAG: hypothetical protein QXW98_04535 [Candidatus Caldarchaeum sp.]